MYTGFRGGGWGGGGVLRTTGVNRLFVTVVEKADRKT